MIYRGKAKCKHSAPPWQTAGKEYEVVFHDTKGGVEKISIGTVKNVSVYYNDIWIIVADHGNTAIGLRDEFEIDHLMNVRPQDSSVYKSPNPEPIFPMKCNCDIRELMAYGCKCGGV